MRLATDRDDASIEVHNELDHVAEVEGGQSTNLSRLEFRLADDNVLRFHAVGTRCGGDVTSKMAVIEGSRVQVEVLVGRLASGTSTAEVVAVCQRRGLSLGVHS